MDIETYNKILQNNNHLSFEHSQIFEPVTLSGYYTAENGLQYHCGFNSQMIVRSDPVGKSYELLRAEAEAAEEIKYPTSNYIKSEDEYTEQEAEIWRGKVLELLNLSQPEVK